MAEKAGNGATPPKQVRHREVAVADDEEGGWESGGTKRHGRQRERKLTVDSDPHSDLTLAMEVKPAPSVGRGAIIVQPSYFTSNIYVDSLRDDLMSLTHKYVLKYNSDSTKPFELFKQLWKADGWPLLHFKVYDPRSREAFLNVSIRIFLEGTIPSQPPLKRAISLFAMYTFFYTQPSSSTPPIDAVSRIPIPIDWLSSLKALPNSLTTPQLSPLRPHATHVIQKLLADKLFDICPSSEFFPLNPRTLPREHYRSVGTSVGDTLEKGKRKAGRPSKHEKAQRAQGAAEKLDSWLKETQVCPQDRVSDGLQTSTHTRTNTGTVAILTTDPVDTRSTYQTDKATLLEMVKHASDLEDTNGARMALEHANQFILARMRRLEEDARTRGLEVGGEGGELTTLSRVEKAAAEMSLEGEGWRGGILGLSNGAGN
ncbi:hypothetical protein ONZ45_g8415 [Pleurotus djamor]|nr:hypothetical protein ONZ45_g8415 [Pleurotus djamor]